MALPFIVGPHQCSLTHGPDGQPQVEIISRIRLPLAEFFDALLLSLADQRLLFPQPDFGIAQASMAPVTVGLQTRGQSCPMTGEATPLHRKAASCAQPKRSPPTVPRRPSRHASKVDPTHEKLLAVLSQASGIPDTEAVGMASTAQDLPTPSNNAGRTFSGASQPAAQAADIRGLKQQVSPPGRDQRHVNTCLHPVPLRILRSAQSSRPGTPVVLSLIKDSTI